MVDRYYRKIEDVKNDIEKAMQISSILLKLKEYDNNLGKIDTNTGNISSNSGLISTNTSSISSNSGLISTNKGNISSNSGLVSTNEGNIFSNLSKITNIENNLIIVNDIYYETFNISRFSVTYKDNRIFLEQFIQILLQMELLKSMLNIIMYMMKIILYVMYIVFIIIKDNLKKLY